MKPFGALIAVAIWALPSLAWAETVDVKYGGQVDLTPFTCIETAKSSFLHRVCYDEANTYMLINLNGTWYHYCEIDARTVQKLLDADSIGSYYNANIRAGRFDCRTHRIPSYN